MNDKLVSMLAEDSQLIPYRKSLRVITGSVTAAILLQQITFRSKQVGWQPFYKFRGPCDHRLYKPGDSWTEELGFSGSEFDTALGKIGTKIVKGKSKGDVLQLTDPTSLVLYWTTNDRVTYYDLNKELLGNCIKSNYLVNDKSRITKFKKAELPINREDTREYQETTREGGGGESVRSPAFVAYETEIGFLSPIVAQKVTAAIEDYPEQWIVDAIGISAENNKRRWNYVEAILKRWKVEGKENGKKAAPKGEKILDPVTGDWTGGYYGS